jgi:hypothetical protein
MALAGHQRREAALFRSSTNVGIPSVAVHLPSSRSESELDDAAFLQVAGVGKRATLSLRHVRGELIHDRWEDRGALVALGQQERRRNFAERVEVKLQRVGVDARQPRQRTYARRKVANQ